MQQEQRHTAIVIAALCVLAAGIVFGLVFAVTVVVPWFLSPILGPP